MDFFDFLPIAPGPEPARGGSREENLAGGAVVFGLPLIDLILLTVTDLSKHPNLALCLMAGLTMVVIDILIFPF